MPPKKAAAPVTGMRAISSFFAKASPTPALAKEADQELAEVASKQVSLATPVGAKNKVARSPSKASSEAKTSKKTKTDDEPPASPIGASPARGEKLEARLAGRAAADAAAQDAGAGGAEGGGGREGRGQRTRISPP